MGAMGMKKDVDRYIMKSWLSILGLSIVFLTQSGWAYTTEDCVRCHREESTESRLKIGVQSFKASVHGDKAACQECHTGIVDEKHVNDRTLGAVRTITQWERSKPIVLSVIRVIHGIMCCQRVIPPLPLIPAG